MHSDLLFSHIWQTLTEADSIPIAGSANRYSEAMQMQLLSRLCCGRSAASMIRQLPNAGVLPPQPGVVGVCKVTREAYPDPTVRRNLTLMRVCCRRSRGWWACAR